MKKATGPIDNYGVPFASIGSFWWGNLESDVYDSENIGSPLGNTLQASKPYLFRFKREGFDSDLRKQINSKKFDLVILELGLDDLINAFTPVGGTGVSTGRTDFIKDILKTYTKDKNTKVCLSNLPAFIGSPFLNSITLEMINNGTGNTEFNWGDGTTSKLLDEKARFLPNSEIDSLVSKAVSIALKPGIKPNRSLSRYSVASDPSLRLRDGKTQYDIEIEEIAKETGYAIADLRGLYQKIYTGKYVEDGVLIDPKWPNGNFFSSDGIFPTALGQAVVANEFIRAINQRYKSEIPLIKISEYVSRK